MATNFDYDTKGMSTAKVHNGDSFAVSLEQARGTVSALLNAIEQLSDTLCGGRVDPRAGGGAGGLPHSVPSGLFEEAKQRADDISTDANRGVELVNRIRAALP